MNVYVEYMVKREISKADQIKKIIWICLCVVFGLMVLLFADIFMLLPLAVVLFLTIRHCKQMGCLYEYVYADGELTFTRVEMSSRKKLYTCNMERADQVCPYKEFRQPGKPFSAKRDYSSGVPSDALYVMVVNGQKGKEQIFFEPNQEMLLAMRRMYPATVKMLRS